MSYHDENSDIELMLQNEMEGYALDPEFSDAVSNFDGEEDEGEGEDEDEDLAMIPFDAYAVKGRGSRYLRAQQRIETMTQLNLVFSASGADAEEREVDVFNLQNSSSKVVLKSPILAGILPASANNYADTQAVPVGTAGWLVDGTYVVKYAADKIVTLQCQQIPYRVLFDSLATISFRIRRLRITSGTQSQSLIPFDFRSRTSFGAGNFNALNPSVSPEQNQDKVTQIFPNVSITRNSYVIYSIQQNEQLVNIEMRLDNFVYYGRKMRRKRRG